MSNNIEIVKTSDGSHSLYVKELEENYHSQHGAIQEAKHVFLQNGLAFFNKQNISVLEVGFGTGLNALLTLDFALNKNKNITYTGIETNLLDYSLIQQLNYLEQLNSFHLEGCFCKMHECKAGEEVDIVPRFKFKKVQQKIQDYTSNNEVDIVFYDAFSPTSQIEMWDITIFKKLYQSITKGGVLVTYCAKGQLKRDLRSVGFEVESLPGPPGKREMVRAIKN